ncbi:MAG: lysylphosphatidylglycerol synthase transmembrane domain-containing protein, partial [Phycisphaeraceae bacterium]
SLLGLALLGVSVWFLQRELREMDLTRVGWHIQQMPAARLAIAAGLCLAGYVVILGYDFLALRYVGGRLPTRRILFNGYVSTAFSNTIAVPVVGVGGMRLRLYAGTGLSPRQIGELIAFVGVSAWLGLLLLASGSAIVHPPQVEAVPADVWVRGGAAGVLVGLAGFLALCAWRDALKLLKWHLRLPTFRQAAGMMLVGLGDWLAQVLLFFALLPSLSLGDLGWFIPVYTAAMLLAMLGHAPAGLGILDAGVLVLLSARVDQAELIGALALTRLIYHLSPLLIAMLLFAGFEWRHFKRLPGGAAGENHEDTKKRGETQSPQMNTDGHG